jgi:hypothetical protein
LALVHPDRKSPQEQPRQRDSHETQEIPDPEVAMDHFSDRTVQAPITNTRRKRRHRTHQPTLMDPRADGRMARQAGPPRPRPLSPSDPEAAPWAAAAPPCGCQTSRPLFFEASSPTIQDAPDPFLAIRAAKSSRRPRGPFERVTLRCAIPNQPPSPSLSFIRIDLTASCR